MFSKAVQTTKKENLEREASRNTAISMGQ